MPGRRASPKKRFRSSPQAVDHGGHRLLEAPRAARETCTTPFPWPRARSSAARSVASLSDLRNVATGSSMVCSRKTIQAWPRRRRDKFTHRPQVRLALARATCGSGSNPCDSPPGRKQAHTLSARLAQMRAASHQCSAVRSQCARGAVLGAELTEQQPRNEDLGERADRDLRPPRLVRCSMATVGGMRRSRSTSGRAAGSTNWRRSIERFQVTALAFGEQDVEARVVCGARHTRHPVNLPRGISTSMD